MFFSQNFVNRELCAEICKRVKKFTTIKDGKEGRDFKEMREERLSRGLLKTSHSKRKDHK